VEKRMNQDAVGMVGLVGLMKDVLDEI